MRIMPRTDDHTGTIEIIDYHPRLGRIEEDVISGLSRHQKELPPKLFYDLEGSELFEEITELDEYYPTRCEIAILETIAGELAEIAGDHVALIELGSGSSRKTRIILDALRGRCTYLPVDISKEFLRSSAESINHDYPEVDVVAICADYTRPFEIPHSEQFEKRIVFFPGSNIGNMIPERAETFLRSFHEFLLPGDGALIGVDLRKDAAILHAAYNDSRGVTARFNMNVLRRLNRELGADFDVDQFEHVAWFDDEKSRVEMHLRSLANQSVHIGEHVFTLERGETIHTENSCKYSIDGFRSLAARGGFTPLEVWTDPDSLFSEHYLEIESS
jgi:dimethylhistidine N-methyltransferase